MLRFLFFTVSGRIILTCGFHENTNFNLVFLPLSLSHFKLIVSKHQPYISDAHSTNGTKLNGGKVSAEE